MPNRRLVAVAPVLFAAATLSSCADAPPELGSRSDAIIMGTPATVGQFPQVVAILNRGLCTGTLVAPDIVLTAGHCVHPSTLGVGSQAQVTAATTVVLDTVNVNQGGGRQIAAADTRVIGTFRNPGDDDIGLIFLAEQVTDRAPAVIHPGGPGLASTPVDLVGFGETETGAFGRLLFALGKAQTGCAAFGVDGTEFICLDQRSGAGICSGDSGGPAFASIDGAPRVVGITSFGDQSCTQLGAHYRTDAPGARAFLQSNAPQLLCRADGVCDTLCSAAPDPDCRQTCATSDECGDGEYCAADDTCSPEPFSDGGVGSECTTNEACASNMCARSGDEQRCVDLCVVGEGSCPDGFDCLASAGAGGVCWPGAAEEDGGICAAGGGRGQGAATLLLVVGALGLVSRRRRRHGR